MTAKRKIAVGITLVALAITIALCWPRWKGYTYQGKTVEEWFKNYCTDGRENDAYFAFRDGIGTNAVPFLVGRLTRDFRASRAERLANMFPARWRPLQRIDQAWKAKYLLQDVIKPPEAMLRDLRNPDLPVPNRYVITPPRWNQPPSFPLP